MSHPSGQPLRDRPAAVHEELLQNKNLDTLLTIGEECCRVLSRTAKEWGWVVRTPGLDRMQHVGELRRVPPLYWRRSVVEPSGSEEVSLQDLANGKLRASRSLQETELLFCRRATEMGNLFDTFRIQRNRLQHHRHDVGIEDAGVLASAVLVLVKLAGSDLVEPERLEPLSGVSRRALGALYGEAVDFPKADEADEGAVAQPELPDRLARIERNQESILSRLDGLAPAIDALRRERDDDLADSSAMVADDAPKPSSSLSRRRDALIQLRNRIYMQNHIENWQNICQRPIVEALLEREEKGRGIRDVKELNDVPAFRTKYEKHRDVMEPLVQKYGAEMLRLVAGKP